MKKYRIKEIVEAIRWLGVDQTTEINIELYSGTNKDQICVMCNQPLHMHGKYILPDASYDLFCPGDWLIKYNNGKIYPCDHETFIKMYEEID